MDEYWTAPLVFYEDDPDSWFPDFIWLKEPIKMLSISIHFTEASPLLRIDDA